MPRPRLTAAILVLTAAGLAACGGASSMRGGGGVWETLTGLAAWFGDPAQWRGLDGIPTRLAEHLYYVGVSMAAALALALPVGVGLGHLGRGGFLAINLANVGRAVPELGIVIIVFILVGYGDWPVITALIALAVPPIVTNSYVGMREVAPATKQAAVGMGMTGAQVLWRVELPIALPVIMAGIRTSTVQVVATATIGAFVGLGGLGRYVIDGLAQHRMDQVLGGAISVAVLALITEFTLAGVQRLIVPAGIRLQRTT